MLMGPVRHNYSVKEQADSQGLRRYVNPRFTRVVNISGAHLDINKADSLIADSDVRNEMVISDVIQAVKAGRTPAILTKLKRHERLVWHGGMNLLGKADAYDNLIRVENEQAAAELLEKADLMGIKSYELVSNKNIV